MQGWLKAWDPSYLEELWDILEGVHADLEISRGVVYGAGYGAALGSSPNVVGGPRFVSNHVPLIRPPRKGIATPTHFQNGEQGLL